MLLTFAQICEELWILLSTSLPLICTSLLQSSQVGRALIFVGRIGENELVAVSLATLTANVTGWAVYQGLASALDTFCPQAYGAGLFHLVGLHTQRMLVLLLCVTVPICFLWCVCVHMSPFGRCLGASEGPTSNSDYPRLVESRHPC